MSELSHVDANGKAHMVDVGAKEIVHRYASASGKILLSTHGLSQIKANQLKKGDALATAKIAGIMAAKQTSNLIPLCHPLLLDHIDLELVITADGVEVTSHIETTARTGVEMEALTAVSVALLTIYDMCKAVDKTMVIQSVQLIKKTKTPLL